MNDITGMKYNMLTALYRSGANKDGSAIWRCKCDCGNYCDVVGYKIKNGHTKSCGCLKSKIVSERNKKNNTYDISGEYGIGYATNTGNEFIFDKEDLEKITKYTWLEKDGYIVSISHGKNIRMHRLILDMLCDDKIIDHINNNRSDNRKSNLRIATKQTNGINRPACKNSSTGIKGVRKNKNGKYEVSIHPNGKTIYIGTYDSLDKARTARINKEIELFGEYAYINY